MRPRSGRRGMAFGLVAVVVLAAAGVVGTAALRRSAPSGPAAGTPVQPPCGARGDEGRPMGPAPVERAHTVIDPADPDMALGVSSLRVLAGAGGRPDRLYVLSDRGEVVVYDLDPTVWHASFPVALPGLRTTMAVDPSGDVYLAADGGLHKYSPEGALVWARPASGVPDQGVFGLRAKGGFRVGIVVRRPGGGMGTDLFDTDGGPAGQIPVTGRHIGVGPTGQLVSTDGHFVRTYRPSGELISEFGSSLGDNDPGPFHLRLMGGAVSTADGTVYVTSAGNGIVAFTGDGIHLGFTPDEGAAGVMTQGAPMEQHDGRIYYATGKPFSQSQGVSWLTPAELKELVDAERSVTPRLGIGAGLEVSAPAGYFPPGQRPEVNVTFEPWWSALAGSVKGEYTVRERRQVLARESPTPKRFDIPDTPGNMQVALGLPPAEPGYYEVEARLLKAGKVVSADCLYYSVGSPGNTLAFPTLPPGMDFGGPRPARAVALADELGFGLVRATVDWRLLLPDPASTGPLDFSAYDADFKAAAQLAAARGVTFEVLLGGNVHEKALVENGSWGRRVQELVEHYKADVRVWEAWNEPNNTIGPADRYVSQVLRPVFESVRAADPGARVVGGSVLEMNLGYWEAIGTAGGFPLMDVVGIHPYTGNNRSFEEHGIPELLARFAQLLAAHDATSKPVWDTESGWWADGPANYYSQADKLVRAQVLLRQAGVDTWAYFITEGGYGDYGLSYSLIQTPTVRSAHSLKPAALAAMNYRSTIGDRPFLRMVETATPSTYAALFGPAPGSAAPDGVVVVWADDFKTELRVQSGEAGRAGPLTVTDVMGARAQVATGDRPVTVPIDGSPRFVRFPGSVAPAFAAVEPFGPDVALATAGGRASASTESATNRAAAAIDGVSDAQGKGDFPGLSAWAQAPGDEAPSLTVTLPGATNVDRVMVSTHSFGSVVTGLRSYDISVREGEGPWATVAKVRDEFLERRRVVGFSARPVTEVRIDVVAVNFGGYYGGARPSFWPRDRERVKDPSQPWYGPAMVYEVAVYGPGGSAGPG